jgi:ABC-2 type transport system permease protein
VKGRLLSLILAQLNMNFAISHSRYYYLEKRQRLWEGILIVVSIIMTALVLSFGVYKLACAFYSQAAIINQEALTLTTGILAAQFLMLILGVALVIAVFYFSNDLPVLIPLPLRPWEVLASKFAVILCNEYLGLLVFITPIFVAYGMRADVSLISYALSAIIVFLTLPVIPIAIASILSVILMRVVGFTKRKDILTIIGGFLLTGLIIGVQLYLQTKLPARGDEQEFIMQMLSQANSLVAVMGRQFPPSIWATWAVSEAGTSMGLLSLCLFLGVGAVSFGLFLALGDRFFYQGVLSGFEAPTSRRGALVDKQGRHGFSKRTPLLSLAVTEMKLFSRTPVFVLNGFIGFLMFPVMFVVLLVMGNDPQMAGLWDSLATMPEFHSIGALLVAAYFFMLTAFSGIPFSPFSREGKANIWFLRSQPISGHAAAMGKALAAEIMIVAGAIPGLAVFEYIARLPIASLIIGVSLGIASSYALCIWGVLLDMARPMLDWTDQQRAIKSNLNTVIGMLIGMVALFLIGYLVYVLFRRGYSGLVAQVMSGAIIALILGSGLRVLRVAGDKLWSRVEL